MPRVEVSPGFLVVLGALFWLDEGVGLLPWGLLACFFHELGHVVARSCAWTTMSRCGMDRTVW